MSKNAAAEHTLGALHTMVAERFIKLVKATDDHRLLNAAAKFLADNKITAVPNEGDNLSELEAALGKRTRKFADLGAEATKLASDSIH